MSEHEQANQPAGPGRRFSWRRVGEGVFLAALAVGTVAVVWLIPWPLLPKSQTPTTLSMKDNIEGLKKAAQRKAAERADREGEGK